MDMKQYEARMNAHGRTRRGVTLKREQRELNNKLPHSLSYHTATVDEQERQVAIINSDNLDIKFIYGMPGEDIRHGSYVEWMDQHWLVIEKDYNTEVYAKAKMQQCNYLLKWVDDKNVIHEQWCIVEDGTKLEIVSVQRNLYDKILIELLEIPKAIYTTA